VPFGASPCHFRPAPFIVAWDRGKVLAFVFGVRAGMVNMLLAAHQLAWAQYPQIWLCESCAILWLVIRTVRSGWVRAGVLLMLCGLLLNRLVTAANAGTMPVVGMPSTVHPLSVMWRAATSKTRLPYLADQARLGFFSIGDLVMLVGGSLIIATCVHTVFRKDRGLVRSAWLKVLQTIISASNP